MTQTKATQIIKKMGALLMVMVMAFTIIGMNPAKAAAATAVPAAGGAPVLTVIDGSNSATLATFDAADFDNLPQVTNTYSWGKNPPAKDPTEQAGITVPTILDAAGVDTSKLTAGANIKFTAVDNFSGTYTWGQAGGITAGDRYYLDTDGTQLAVVPFIITPTTDPSPIRLYFGQLNLTDFNYSRSISNVVTITVTPDNGSAVPMQISVSNITGVPTTAIAGKALTLKGTVAPANATHKTITWSVKSAGTTGATISGSTLKATTKGTVIITATVKKGNVPSSDYTKNFSITVKKLVSAVFKANGGKVSNGKASKSLSIAQGTKIGKLPAVTRKGYSFQGWYTQKTGGTKIASSFVVKANKSFYAHWARIGHVNSKSAYASLRTKAGASKIIASYPTGTKVQIFSKKGSWYKVKVGKKTGYMYAPFVTPAKTK